MSDPGSIRAQIGLPQEHMTLLHRARYVGDDNGTPLLLAVDRLQSSILTEVDKERGRVFIYWHVCLIFETLLMSLISEFFCCICSVVANHLLYI